MDIYETKKAQVFISYTGDDRPLVANFVARLTDEAIAAAAVVWYDSNLTPSWEWDEEIMRRLHSADIILVLASQKFFQSPYCLERELPVIRGRVGATGPLQAAWLGERPPARTAVRVIRLRAFDGPRPEIEGLPVWPDGDRTLQTVAPDGPEMRELRIWLKVEICKALVARHAERYDGRSREEEIRRRNEEFDPLGGGRQYDDLTYLHDQLGVHVTSGRRLAAGGVGGLLLGAAAGLATKAWLLHGAMTSVVGPVLFFAALGFVVGVVKPGFRGIELMLDSLRGRGDGPSLRAKLGATLGIMTPFVMLAGLVYAVIAGIMLGLPVGAVLSIGGWSLDIGLAGAAAIGGVLCGYAGLDFGSSFTEKRLKVFTDVRHVYQPPVVEPLPPPVRCEPPRAVAAVPPVADDPPAAPPVPSPAPTPTAVAPDAAPGPEPDRDDAYLSPKSVGDVRPSLTVVAAAARGEEACRLMAALQADYCDDVFRITVITDADPCADDPGYWKRALAGSGRCLVLMTAELARGPVPAAVARALAGRSSWEPRKFYPVLVEPGLPTGAPLMDLQGLPTGQMPVRDWPVRENAWANVSRTVLADELGEFLARLDMYLGRVLSEEEQARQFGDRDRSPREVQSALRDYHLDLLGGETFVDPRYDLTRFPFRHRAWYWSLWGAGWWAAAGAVCLGSVGNAIAAGLDSSASSGFPWVAGHVLPAVALVVALAYLTLRETLRYATIRLNRFFDDATSSVLGFFIGAGSHPLKRRPILVRTARLLICPLVLLAAVTAASAGLGGSSDEFGHAAGAAVGLACYIVSRYRVPAVVVHRRAAPTPHDMAVTRRGLTWTIRTPRENHPEIVRGGIGPTRSPRPRLIEGYYEELSVSAWMVLRAVVDAGWITAAGAATALGLVRLGLFPGLAVWVALYVVSVVVHLVGYRPRVRRWEDESWLRAVWITYRPLVLARALRTNTYLLVALLAVAGVNFLVIKADLGTARWLGLGCVGAGVFGLRLFHQVAKTSQTHYPGRLLDPPARRVGDDTQPVRGPRTGH